MVATLVALGCTVAGFSYLSGLEEPRETQPLARPVADGPGETPSAARSVAEPRPDREAVLPPNGECSAESPEVAEYGSEEYFIERYSSLTLPELEETRDLVLATQQQLAQDEFRSRIAKGLLVPLRFEDTNELREHVNKPREGRGLGVFLMRQVRSEHDGSYAVYDDVIDATRIPALAEITHEVKWLYARSHELSHKER